jgi:hypothetical protein
VPAHERDLRRQEWIAELLSIPDEKTLPRLLSIPALLVFPLSLAWSLRRGAWSSHQPVDLFSRRAAFDTVTAYVLIAYFLVPSLASIGFAVGTGVAVVVATAAPAIPGSGAVSIPAMPADAGFPAVPTGAAIVGAVVAVITVASLVILMVLVALNWFPRRRSDGGGVGQPAGLDRSVLETNPVITAHPAPANPPANPPAAHGWRGSRRY